MKKKITLLALILLCLFAIAWAEQTPDATETPVITVPANPASLSQAPIVSTPTASPTSAKLLHAGRVSRALRGDALPLSGLLIGLDPGHQAKGNSQQEPVSPGSSETKAKVSSGTAGVSTRIAEYVTNLEIGLQMRDVLQALGAEVIMTREVHEIDISNVERALMMNEAGADICLRLHCNGSTNQEVDGITLYVKATGTGAQESYDLAELLLPAMLNTTGADSRGIVANDNYTGLNWCDVPSILVEMGFMSNPREDELLNDPEYQKKLIDGMILGLAEYLGRPLTEEQLALAWNSLS